MAQNSIKTFLVLNLVLSVALVSTLAIVGNLFLEHQAFKKNLDNQLSLNAHTIMAFSSNTKDFRAIQDSINVLEAPGRSKHAIKNSIQYLILNMKNHVLLKSKGLPQIDLSNFDQGFHSLWIKKHPWRIYCTQNLENGHKIYTLQRHDFRAKFEKQITKESFIVMLASFPFLGLLIWAIVNKGLSGIEETAKSIRQRKRNNLTPLTIKDPPSEIVPLIKSINSLLKRLESAFNREQRFAGDAAHELRTPIAALSAHLQLAQKEKDLNKIRAYLEKVSNGVERSSHVIDQLLTLSRMAPDCELKEPQNIQLEEISRDILIETLPFSDKKNITVELISNSTNHIKGNPDMIMIMLRNLIDNAIRYSPQDSLVKIEINENAQNIILEVKDQGPGIPDNLKSRVFERFFRIMGNNTKGSGLGLGIVKQIADTHNAKITLEDNKPGLNCKITFMKPKK